MPSCGRSLCWLSRACGLSCMLSCVMLPCFENRVSNTEPLKHFFTEGFPPFAHWCVPLSIWCLWPPGCLRLDESCSCPRSFEGIDSCKSHSQKAHHRNPPITTVKLLLLCSEFQHKTVPSFLVFMREYHAVVSHTPVSCIVRIGRPSVSRLPHPMGLLESDIHGVES